MKKKKAANVIQKLGFIIFLLGLGSANLFTFVSMGIAVLVLELLGKALGGEFLDDLLAPPEDRIEKGEN